MSQIITELRKIYLDVDQKMFPHSHFGAHQLVWPSEYTDIFAQQINFFIRETNNTQRVSLSFDLCTFSFN